MHFVDKSFVHIVSGKGGKGSVSFRRESRIPRGGPDGGHGGKGGSIFFEADPSLSSLYSYQRQRTYIAENGGQGGSRLKSGASGKDLVLKVPLGTLVKNDKDQILYDFSKPYQRCLVAEGGQGGKGNSFFKNSIHQAPYEFQSGEKGEEKNLYLELKTIADVGLLGFPNSGKSTLISKISNSKSKVADYAFTTLHPNIGVVKDTIYSSFKVADVPGLIEGAHLGKGLGHRFLSHLERTSVLAHLIDVSVEFSEIFDRYEKIQNEITEYDKEFISDKKDYISVKPQLIVLNKSDLIEESKLIKIKKEFLKRTKKDVVDISSKDQLNLDVLVLKLREHLGRIK